ncbi:HK97 family phage major capsid protein [Microbacterium sp. ZKA21]|uniref:phage major capsid protein n=1 Tax=Microbacterium sp. ZKA21 TaxID=3381694 RepID=UPI003D2598C5
MALFTNTEDVSGILPEDYASLIVQPTRDAAVALQDNVSTVIVTDSHDLVVPIVVSDGDAGWYTEGADMSGDDGELDSVKITPAKVGRVRKISNELADDSSPEAQELVATMIGQAIATGIDQAFFGTVAAPAPAGLPSVAATVSNVNGVTAWADLDPFAEAISISQANNGIISAFVASPGDALALMSLKTQADSNVPLLGTDATSATARRILGVPLLVSQHVEPGVIWGLDKRFVTVALRKDVDIDVSRERYFETDQTAVKGAMRVSWAFTHPKALVRITLAAA